MKDNRTLTIVLRTLAVVLFMLGLIFWSIQAIKNHMRQDVSDNAISIVESVIDEGGADEITFEVPKSDFLAVDGEAGEDDTSLEELLREMQDLSSEHETLTLIGIIEIPCIDVKEPIWDSCPSLWRRQIPSVLQYR